MQQGAQGGRIFKHTGIAFPNFNTLYQLLAMQMTEPETLERAATMLFMPDLFTYFLTGEKKTEFTEATTSQMLDAATGQWSRELLDKLDIPHHFLTEIDYPRHCTGQGKIRNCRFPGYK